MRFKEYSNPEGTGWKGWLENGNGTAIGFVALDGRCVFDWYIDSGALIDAN